MYLTVREVLTLPPLTELTLVAGQSGLDREVTRVSVLELVHGPGTWWRGGEFFMSTLSALRHEGSESYAELIRTLASEHAAALALHPGTDGHRHLEATKAAADQCGIPLMLMPHDLPYSVVTDAVMGGLLGRQAALLERSAAISRELIQIILRGGDLAAICRAVARRTGRPVAVIGSDGVEVLGHSGRAGQFGCLLPQLLAHRSICGGDAPVTSAPSIAALNVGGPGKVLINTIMTPDGPLTQVAAPIAIHGETYAFLVTWEVESALTELDFTVLAHACTAVGLEVLKRRAIVETERRIQLDFYGAALSGEIGSMVEAEHRVRQAGVELAPAYVVAALAWGSQLPASAARELSRWTGATAIFHTDSLILVLPLFSRHPTSLNDVSRMLERIVELANPANSRIPVGLSMVTDGVLQLPAALAEARLALSVAEHLRTESHPLRYDHLGVFGLLADVTSVDSLQHYARRSLDRLLTAHNGSVLADTLEAYLDMQGSPSRAADVLHVHVNTIKYRLERARSILGDQALDDPSRRLGLHLAFKFRHLES